MENDLLIADEKEDSVQIPKAKPRSLYCFRSTIFTCSIGEDVTRKRSERDYYL
jgi:hypothetical protein